MSFHLVKHDPQRYSQTRSKTVVFVIHGDFHGVGARDGIALVADKR